MNNRSWTDFFLMILIGVLVMLIAIPTGEGKKKEVQESGAVEEKPRTVTQEEYEKRLTEELTGLLEQMEGAGKCRVMISLEDEGRVYVDKNVVSGSDRREESTVVYDTGSGETPYVLCEERPKVAGVVVVAEGGGNAIVVSNISRAVMSLFQIEAHKITVVKMSVQED
ncbi:MAG: hypothetical protein NC180_05390 [Muribaculaceae bacterium]|nr:hypothetical protein [Muribaculaceae bacterium]MCM1492641.1 hypothetical protein [Muribaculaceae bacterium]